MTTRMLIGYDWCSATFCLDCVDKMGGPEAGEAGPGDPVYANDPEFYDVGCEQCHRDIHETRSEEEQPDDNPPE